MNDLFAKATNLERNEQFIEAENLLLSAAANSCKTSPENHLTWHIRARLGSNLALQLRFDDALLISKLVIENLIDTLSSDFHNGDSISAIATAEITCGLCFQQLDDDAQAIEHFQNAMTLFDLTEHPDPEDAVFALFQFLISSGIESNVDPQASYKWAQPYLCVLPEIFHANGAKLLMWLGHFADIQGQREFAKDMYLKAIVMAKTKTEMSVLESVSAEVLRESLETLFNISPNVSLQNH